MIYCNISTVYRFFKLYQPYLFNSLKVTCNINIRISVSPTYTVYKTRSFYLTR